MSDNISGRVREILTKIQGKSNKDRTGYFTELARGITAINPEAIIGEYGIPFSGQAGFGLVIPPNGGMCEDSEYILLAAHMDSAPSLFNLFGRHRPGANDNGFAAAFNIAYGETIASENMDKGIIIGGFPHEEGQGIYKLIGAAALASLAGILSDRLLGSIFNATNSFLLGYFAALQGFDVVGGPFKQGLAGSAKPFREVLESDLGIRLEQITSTINMDMTGSAGSVTELIIPYDSPTVNPGRWVFLKKMDRGNIADIEVMLALALAQTENTGIDNLIVHHHLLLGTSDHAELARYLNGVAGILHINNWNDLHTKRDTDERISFQNAQWYKRFLDFYRQNIGTVWKKEEDISVLRDRRLISCGKFERASIYELEEQKYCILRMPGTKLTNPLNVLYKLIPGQNRGYIAEFVTYGFQDNPKTLLNSPDSNLRLHLNRKIPDFKKSEDNSISIYLNGEKISFRKNARNIREQAATYLTNAATYLADRSLAAISLGLVGICSLAYSVRGSVTSPGELIMDYTTKITQNISQTGIGSIIQQIPGFFEMGIVSAIVVLGMMRAAPPIKRKIRHWNIEIGNNGLDYRLHFDADRIINKTYSD